MPVSKRPDKYEAPSWDYIYELCVELADKIKTSKFKPDLIVAIALGGWIPARLLSDLLENTCVASIKVEHYVGLYETKEKPEITQLLPVEVKGKRLLIVDDVVDSGCSVNLAREYLREHGAKDVKVASIYYKPWSVLTPDYYARETDAWICFPHETLESIRRIYEKLRKKGMSRQEIEVELLLIGIKPQLVQKFLPQIAQEDKS